MGKRRILPQLALAMGLFVGGISTVADAKPASATTTCWTTSRASSEYRAFGMRWYRHEAAARACRNGNTVTSAEARTNRIVKIGIAALDWTDKKERVGRDWTNHYVAAGIGEFEITLPGGIKIKPGLNKKHEFDYDFVVRNNRLVATRSATGWYW